MIPQLAVAASVSAACTARQLAAADLGTRTRGDQRITRIEVVNNSSRPCVLRGYPKLTFTRESGYAPIVALRATPVAPGYHTSPAGNVVIASLRHASFFLEYPRFDAHGVACAPVSNIVIGGFATPGTVTLPDTIAPCGQLNISPYFRVR